MAIRAITFDFWYTLFKDANKEARKKERLDAFHEATGASREDIDAAMRGATAEFARCHLEEQRTLRPEDAVRMALDTLGVSLSAAVHEELSQLLATSIVRHSAVPIEGAFEAVRAASMLMPVGVISDSGVSPGYSLTKLLDRHGFTPLFSALVFSDEVGVAKPQPPMFETAAQSLDVPVDELLHIGDLEHTDVAGAHALGAQAALFIGENDEHHAGTQADYVFASWQDFLEVLPALC